MNPIKPQSPPAPQTSPSKVQKPSRELSVKTGLKAGATWAGN